MTWRGLNKYTDLGGWEFNHLVHFQMFQEGKYNMLFLWPRVMAKSEIECQVQIKSSLAQSRSNISGLTFAVIMNIFYKFTLQQIYSCSNIRLF